MFHNVIINKNCTACCNHFCNHSFYYSYCKTVPLHDKILTSKLVLLIFLFDLFGILLDFLTMFDIYRMLMNYTLDLFY